MVTVHLLHLHSLHHLCNSLKGTDCQDWRLIWQKKWSFTHHKACLVITHAYYYLHSCCSDLFPKLLNVFQNTVLLLTAYWDADNQPHCTTCEMEMRIGLDIHLYTVIKDTNFHRVLQHTELCYSLLNKLLLSCFVFRITSLIIKARHAPHAPR